MTTGYTKELGLGLPVAGMNMPANGTHLGSVPRVYDPNRNSLFHSFVFCEHPELGESPTRMPSPLCPSYRCPSSNASEFLNGDSVEGALGTSHNAFRYDMVNVFPEPSLPMSRCSDTLPSGFGIPGLKSLAMFEEPLTDGLDLLSSEGRPVRSGSQVDDPKINSKPALGLNGSSVWNVNCDKQHPFPIPVDQIGFAFGSAEKFSVPDFDGHFGSAVDCPEGDLITFPSQDSGVVDASVFVEDLESVLAKFIGVGYDAYGPNDKLAGKASEPCTALFVKHPVKLEPVELFRFESLFGHPVTDFLEGLDSIIQRRFLRSVGDNFDCQGFLHTHMILRKSLDSLLLAHLFASAQFLCRLKTTVSLEESL